jgi:hypothetical protein
MEINSLKWTCAPTEHHLNPPFPASLVAMPFEPPTWYKERVCRLPLLVDRCAAQAATLRMPRKQSFASNAVNRSRPDARSADWRIQPTQSSARDAVPRSGQQLNRKNP